MPDPEFKQMSRAEALFGTVEPVQQMLRLAAGALSIDFDQGAIRYVHWGSLEVIRAVAFVVRNTTWGTCVPEISDMTISQKPDHFRVGYAARVVNGDGTFAYRAEIEGQAAGSLTFKVNGSTPHGFVTARTGFVVLHPLAGVTGKSVRIDHASGGHSVANFPELVKPTQPVFDIRSLTHEPAEELHVAIDLQGDTFEMEDHRNWTDASFKTYVRPLEWGYPYTIAPDETIDQAVTVAVSGTSPQSRQVDDRSATVSVGAITGKMPRFGLFLPSDDIPAASVYTGRVSELKPAFIIGRIDVRIGDPDAHFDKLASTVSAIGCPLALEVVVPGIDPKRELSALNEALRHRRVEIDNIVVFPARDLQSRPVNSVPDGEVEAAAILAAARAAFPGFLVGGGMPCGFSELNRNPPPSGIDFVTHSTAAIYHAADDLSVMETLEALQHIVRSTRALVGDIPYRISPATIGLPTEWAAGVKAANRHNIRMTMADRDPRSRGLFGAAFALGYAAIAIEQGIDMLSLAAPTGSFGLFDGKVTHPLFVLASGLFALSGKPRIATQVVGSTSVVAFAGESLHGPVLWLANIGRDVIDVRISDATFETITQIDAAALGQFPADAIAPVPVSGNMIRMDSYALCRLT